MATIQTLYENYKIKITINKQTHKNLALPLNQEVSFLLDPTDLAIFSELYSPTGHQLEGSGKDLMFC